MFERAEIKEENDIIRAKALPGTKKKKTANLPERVRHQRRLLSRLRARAEEPAGRRGVPLRPTCSSATSSTAPIRPTPRRTTSPACSCSAAGGSSAGSAPIAAATSTTCATISRRSTRALPPSTPTCTACRTSRSRRRSEVAIRGNPFKPGDEVPRHFPSVLRRRRAAPFTKGSGRLELADEIVQAADRDAGDRQPHLEVALRHRPRELAEQLRQARRAADQSRAARVPGELVRRERLSIKKLQRADHAERGLPVRAPTTDAGGLREGFRQPLVLARQPPPHDARRSCATRRSSSPAASTTKMGGPSEELTPVGDAAHALRQGEPLQARLSSCSSSTSRRRPSAPRSASPPTCRCSACS